MTPPTIAGFDLRTFEGRDIAPLQALFDEDPEYFEINGRAFPVEEMRDADARAKTSSCSFSNAMAGLKA